MQWREGPDPTEDIDHPMERAPLWRWGEAKRSIKRASTSVVKQLAAIRAFLRNDRRRVEDWGN
jgi:hypothetical protein